GRIAIAKVVIKTRQHLAAVKPQGDGLMLELMHFPDELLDAGESHVPSKAKLGKQEMQMAKQLIDSMTTEWNPEEYKDDYREALEKMIEDKIEHGEVKAPPSAKHRKATNVVD